MMLFSPTFQTKNDYLTFQTNNQQFFAPFWLKQQDSEIIG